MGRGVGYGDALWYGLVIAIALTLLSIPPGLVIIIGALMISASPVIAILGIITLMVGYFLSLAVGFAILYKLVVDGVVEGVSIYYETNSSTHLDSKEQLKEQTDGSSDDIDESDSDPGESHDLTELSGIDPDRADALVAAGFDTMEAVASAEIEELRSVEGISQSRAPRIHYEAQNLVSD